MVHAGQRGWGAPGPGPRGLVQVPCPGIPLRVRAEVAPLFTALVQRLDAARRSEGKSQLTSSGGYNLRPVRGYEDRYARTKDLALLSNHSWALAGDLCAGTNPMGLPLRTDMPARTKAIAESCGLTWGAEWSRPDPMHFEFLGTPAEAAQWAARLTQEDDDMFNEQDRQGLVALTKMLQGYGVRIEQTQAALGEIATRQVGYGQRIEKIEGQVEETRNRVLGVIPEHLHDLVNAVWNDPRIDVVHPLSGATESIRPIIALGRAASSVADTKAATAKATR